MRQVTPSPSGPRRRPGTVWLLLCTAAGCAQPLPAQAPPDSARLYYPAAMAASSAQDAVYIVSSNFDQRFDGGWVTPLDVDAWLAHGDLGAALQAAVPRKTPALGGRLALSGDGAHALLTHRGIGMLTVLDLGRDPATGVRTALSCGGPADGGLSGSLARAGCHRSHLIDLAATCALPEDGLAAYRQFQDPFAATALTLADGAEYVAVGYLGAADLTLLRVDLAARPPSVALAQRLGGASLALTSLQAWAPDAAQAGAPARLLGTSRRAADTAGSSAVYELDVEAALAGGGGLARLDIAADAGGTDVVAAVADPDHGHLYAANRAPDSIVVMRREGGAGALAVQAGGPAPLLVPPERWQVVGAAALGSAAVSDMAYVARPCGDLLVAASLAGDALFFFAPQGDTLALVRRMRLAAAGPAGLLPLRRGGAELLLVTTFFDHGLLALDISSADPADFHEVAAYHEADLPRAARHF